MASSYKPSPLSFNSPRASPFRRPSSPSSPTTIIGKPSTPPSKTGVSPMTSPSKLKQSFTAEDQEDEIEIRPMATRSQTEPPPSPTTRGLRPTSASDNGNLSIGAAARRGSGFMNSPIPAQTDNLSKLPPQLLHSMREAFSVLDSDSTGFINSSSVVETLSSLGLQDSINTTSFFPPNQPQQLSLPQFLNSMANILVALSPQQELVNAFSAFDDDDSGQVDISELKDALLNTAPDAGERALSERDVDKALEGFTGRRVFARNAVGITGVKSLGGLNSGLANRNGDVFRYQEFVGNLTGGTAMAENIPGQGTSVQAR